MRDDDRELAKLLDLHAVILRSPSVDQQTAAALLQSYYLRRLCGEVIALRERADRIVGQLDVMTDALLPPVVGAARR